ncbi:MAG: hypothetical protein ABSB35_22405 [Bryobacteraceae bacterium]|jgi:hypothetical protein
MSAPAIPQGDLRERILGTVRDAKKPITFKGLSKLVKAKDEPLRAALELAVGTGEVHRWPDYRRSQYFWHVPPEQAAREAVLAAASAQALPKTDLSRLAAKKLPGFPVKRVENVVSALIAEKQLLAVEPFAKKSKLLVRPGEYEAYFNAARSFVEAKIRLAGFDPAAFFTGNSSPHDKITSAQVDAAALVLEAVRSLEPVKGVPVSTLRLRNHLRNLTKHEFDMAALELRKKQAVFLSVHDDPHNISQEAKDLLIDGQDGTYYVAVAIR